MKIIITTILALAAMRKAQSKRKAKAKRKVIARIEADLKAEWEAKREEPEHRIKVDAERKARAAEWEARVAERKARIAERKEAERRAEAERRKAERKEAERRARVAEWEARVAKRKARVAERKEAERKEAERKEAEANKQRNRISYSPYATYLTKEDEAELRRELKHLIEVRHPALTRKLAEAAGRESKIKKNADYHDTKEQQGFIEGRIQFIAAVLRNATVVEYQGPSDEVRIGSTVIIREDGMNEDEEFKIAGFAAIHSTRRKISWKSPVGSALLGKKKGSEVKVRTPDGPVKFKIVDIR